MTRKTMEKQAQACASSNPQSRPQRYAPICFGDQIHCGFGRVVIVAGWYATDRLKRELDEKEYAAIGHLYNLREGADPFFRNLLANPQATTVLCLSATRQDRNAGNPAIALGYFLLEQEDPRLEKSDDGTGYWVSPSNPLLRIKSDIPLESIRRLRKRITPLCFEGGEGAVQDLVKYLRYENQVTKRAVVEDAPELYPQPEVRVAIQPGPVHGVSVTGETIAQTWLKIIQAIHKTGKVTPTGNGQPWQELISLTAVVTNEPKGFYFPDGDWFPCSRSFLYGDEGQGGYVEQIVGDMPYEEGTKYTYGQRLRSWFGQDQVEAVIQKLVQERDAASGVMSLWDPGSGAVSRPGRSANSSDHTYGKSPCLNHIWVRIQSDGALVLTALFRSNDMFSAWPSNAMGLRCLQEHILERLLECGVEDIFMGPLITVSNSAHIYKTSWESAAALLELYQKQAMTPNYNDPVGNYTVHRDPERGGIVVVRRLTPGNCGQQCDFYEGADPLKLIREIAADAPTIDPAHMGYLGMEISRALSDPDYAQDDRWWQKIPKP